MTTTPPAITSLPAAPDPNDRSTFNTRAYPWSAALPTFSTQVSAVATNVKDNADEVIAATDAVLAAGLSTAAANAVTASAAAVTATTQAGIATTKAGEANTSAIAAAASVASIAGGPVASVNGMTGVVTGIATAAGVQTLTNKTISGADNTLTADGTNAVGFRTIPQVSQSAAYTTVLTDSGKHILHPSADTTARIFTIPANASVAYPIGTAITFVNQASAGVVTIAITTDVMRLAGAGTTGSRTLAANGVATAIKLTATEWIISGSGLT